VDEILKFLNNDAVLTVIGLLFGMAVKDHPALAKVPNATIPYLNALLALVVKLAAAAGGVAPSSYAVGLNFADFHAAGAHVPEVVSTALAAGWQSLWTTLVYMVFIRAPKRDFFTPKSGA